MPTVNSLVLGYNRRMGKDRREEKRAYRAANREKIRASEAAYRAENREAIKEREARRYTSGRARAAVDKYQEANPERVKESRRRWREANPDYGAQYYAANKDRIRERERARREDDPEPERTKTRNRRARIRKAGGTHSAADIQAIFKAQRGKCAHPWCRRSLRYGYHVDHIKPLVAGGSNDRRNIQLLCQPCNQRKHVKDPLDFARQNGLLL